MNVRQAKLEDIDQIAELWAELDDYNMNTLKQFKVFRNNTIGGKDRYLKKLNAMLKDQDCLITVAEDDSKIVGFVTCYVSDSFGNGRVDAYIDVTMVSKDYRGKGVGTNLYKFLEKILKEEGVVGITTDVFDNNESSVNFHEKFGFEKIASAIEMYKKL